MTKLSELPTSAIAALFHLDADGGWDHERSNGWPSPSLVQGFSQAGRFDLIEQSSAYGADCWRLTDEGVEVRRQLDAITLKNSGEA